RDTSLVDPTLPERLAVFARTVAERYEWVRHFTPINEPLTTARFSTLYGLWYPHARSPREFARAVIGQIRAVAAAMRAIREVSPDALLVQTEDLGKTYASPRLQYQADFENERRWLTYDLLCGRVSGDHPIAAYLRWAGTPDGDLDAIASAPCPPDVIGINHYLTSERYLDEHLDRYPAESHGGNGRHRYADIEAVRVSREGVAGPYTLLREAWERYRLPVAVTEAHLACTREQQLRWLDEVWHAGVRLRDEGADVRAVTAWSTFGAFDWASLLTRNEGNYEPGAFDIRAPQPRPTAVAAMIRSLATTGEYDQPVLHAPGWWRNDRRLIYPAAGSASVGQASRSHRSWRATSAAPILVVGANGTLGRAVIAACEFRDIAYRALGRGDLDVADADAVARMLAAVRPWAVINCAGFVRVDHAERERSACWRSNVSGAVALAVVCAERGVAFVTFSSDLVFDGEKGAPYVESDGVRPVCEYGRSKAEAERAVLAASERALVIRTAAFFGHDDHNFVTHALRSLASGRAFAAMRDVVVSPTYVPDLVDATLDHVIDGERGVWHLTNHGAVTWEELAVRAARVAGVSTRCLRGVTLAESALDAPRPRFTPLTSERGIVLAPLESALARYAHAGSWARGVVPRPDPGTTILSGGVAGSAESAPTVGAQGGT
ncbi:MAG TPA: family 1 glycosylhydrolase, partial [Gemmatimonadaceae bacterium]|nr:family 1 glycosylhydrolase [Gemmatimonadaceae bacterium]